MRILFLTQVLPYPLDAGPKIRAYYNLRYLAQKHAITLVSFVRPADTAAAIDHLRQFCNSVHTIPMRRSKVGDAMHLAQSLATRKSFIIARDWVPAMARVVTNIVSSEPGFDAVHADQLWMAPYALLARQQATGPKPLTVLDQHNAVYMVFRRLAAAERNPLKRSLMALEARKLARYEVDICSKFDRVAWVTQEDHAAVYAAAGQGMAVANAGVIPICVDPAGEPIIPRNPNPRRVTFLGGLHYPPNAQGICWFAENVFRQVLGQVPDAVLTVIGKQPPRELAELNIPAANLDVTGYVDDPHPYLAETAVFVVPLLAGGGMRVKILDAWSWGLPIVSTTVGAEGIALRAGQQILIADEPDVFAKAVVSLLCNAAFNQQIGTAGRAWVEQHYNWRTIYQAWDSVYTGAD